ncbi:D-alanyl-D-alanine carboxypeptidase family protein [Actinoallomurus purpureus]|uniref:D-alanyl-D-alanine carboxypeptidase family protein n=1 Tax=Actinoallomurus purpureus TaxID=478114 RepID=UPI002092B9DC|nr:D-alanyl-D-alanine carboxypeptidase family protein [Actinoallomurus purpureus]MCO6006822.1 D-alanyl-D-alanine carboxypeptidase family protein [Actinoallomurus purpureus]
MPSTRSAALIAAITAVVLSLTSGAANQSSAAQSPSADNVKALRKQADKAKNELSKATKAWEARKKQLDASEAKLKATLADLGAANAELNKIREPLAQLAASAYKQPGITGVPSLIGGSDPDQALAAATDLTMLTNDQKALIDKAGRLQKEREQLAASAQELQSNNAVEEAKLQQEMNALKDRAARITAQLTATLKKLDPSTRLQLTCLKTLVPEARKYPNGLIPARYLCPLPQSGRMLRADAALAFYKLNTAYKQRFGAQMCLTDSYRPLAEQQRIYANRPGMAAVPGHSNHGWGTAVDLCGGVQSQGSAQFNWLQANSKKYEFFHPSWAYSSPFEPWHWEYTKENTPDASD